LPDHAVMRHGLRGGRGTVEGIHLSTIADELRQCGRCCRTVTTSLYLQRFPAINIADGNCMNT